jgi:predicted PurR-regulated permease PerM
MSEVRGLDLEHSELKILAVDKERANYISETHKPVDVRNACLTVLAVIAAVFTLRWASPVFIPLMLGLTISYALNPIVSALERWHLPRTLGAGLVMLAIVAGSAWTVVRFSDDANSLVDSLPAAVESVKQGIFKSQGLTESTIDKVQRAAAQLESAAKDSSRQDESKQIPLSQKGVTRVRIERPQFNIKEYLWTGSVGVASSIGQALAVMFIAFFCLASGSTFRRKLVKITGPTLGKKKLTVLALDEITEQVQRYLLVQVAMSALVGSITGLVFFALGVNHAVAWGVASFLLNFIPYLGSIAVTGGSALVGFMQFGSINMAIALGSVCIFLHILTGYLISPWLTSRTGHLNALSVFVGVLAFGWLWGLWGLLLGVPILIMVKAICDRVEDFKPVGELLGR